MSETDMLDLVGVPAPLRLRRHVVDGVCVIEYGAHVLFRYDEVDTGMRNVALVAITNARGVGVKGAAKVFELTPEYVSELRGRARKEGSAGLVKAMGAPLKLSAHQVIEVRQGLGRGVAQWVLAREFKVSRPTIAAVLARYGVLTPQEVLDLETTPAQTDPDTDDAPDVCVDVVDPVGVDPGGALGVGGPDVQGAPGPRSWPQTGSARISQGQVVCRYGGAMLAHAFFTRVQAEAVFASLDTPGPVGGARAVDDPALLCALTLAFGLGISSVEGVKHLHRGQAGALAGIEILPELRTLRPRLARIADGCDPLTVQTTLARAMLAADAPALGVYFVDDHFVPYSGAKPFGKGWNTKRKTAMPGRSDTLVTDFRGRAVAFLTGEPSGLTKTLPPVLDQLRQITGPDAKIMLGFDRGGAYASVFTTCQDNKADWITYRRAPLAETTAQPMGHNYVDPFGVTTRVVLADETVDFKDYGTCRQLSLFEHGKPVLQVLTSDMGAPPAALLSWLRARWRIENAFKDLAAHHGIDWLCQYTADLIEDTTMVANPAREQARKHLDQTQREHDQAAKALAVLVTTPTRPITTINAAIPSAQARLATAVTALTKAQETLKAVPAKLPANQVTPGLMRALPHTKRRTLQMVLRLLAYNSELWLADRLNNYLRDPNEYRAHLRAILHQPALIDFTPTAITVTLEPPATPRLNAALKCLTEELNHTPPHLPGDPRPITYHLQ